MSAKINKDKCIGCGKCVEVCDCEAIELIAENGVVHAELVDECMHCMACADECPVDGAIEFTPYMIDSKEL
jgi:adenylylsulfate reductase subunit B